MGKRKINNIEKLCPPTGKQRVYDLSKIILSLAWIQ